MTLARRMQETRKDEAAGQDLRGTFSWGLGTSGQVGDGGTTSRSSPVQIGSLTEWTLLAGGRYHAHALKSNGTLWGWGVNASGQVGDGSTTNRSSPVQIGSLTTWRDVRGGGGSASEGWAVAVQTDGTLWVWGEGSSGRLGNGNIIDVSSPVQLGSYTNWVYPFAGASFGGAIMSDGRMFVWGRNDINQLGQGGGNRSSPIALGSLTRWTAAAGGVAHTVALQSNGTLWAWGRGSDGQLGQISAAVAVGSPVQIGSLTSWTAVAAGQYHSLALRADGTLWTWGQGTFGQLGQGTSAVSRSSPVQVGSATDWTSIAFSSMAYQVVAGRSNGTLWAWGNNGDGRLGIGDTNNRSSPVQIGSATDWTYPSTARNNSFGLR